jgi:AraC-like DNA-binding protein
MILEGLHEKEIFTEDLPFRIAINNEENFDYPSHWHNAIEIVYISKSNASVKINALEYILKEKDILIVAAGNIHSFHVHSSIGTRFFIQFDLSKLYSFNGTAASKAYTFNTQIITCSEYPSIHAELEEQINKIIQEYNNKAFAYDLCLSARLLDITLILARNFYAAPQANNNNNNNNNKAYDLTKLDKAFEYIEENYKNNISLSDVAKFVGFSTSHFSRAFKKATEKNFHSFLCEFRIKQAEKLLFSNNLTITQLAHAAGFNSIVTFNRCFKQVKGCSPTEYINKRV